MQSNVVKYVDCDFPYYIKLFSQFQIVGKDSILLPSWWGIDVESLLSTCRPRPLTQSCPRSATESSGSHRDFREGLLGPREEWWHQITKEVWRCVCGCVDESSAVCCDHWDSVVLWQWLKGHAICSAAHGQGRWSHNCHNKKGIDL